jgi:peptidoglycan/xylan/chitin deacetylase (PgdA/CDA1 family)
MKRLNIKLAFITNGILLLIVLCVGVVSFFPSAIVPIYGGEKFGAIYRGNVNLKNVSLMFNVYENTDTVSKIVDILDKNNVKATFFVGGCWADDNQVMLEKIVKSGHELGNHGYFHKDHKKLSYEQNEQEISLTEKIVEALCSAKTKLFAPPSGSYSDVTLECAFNLGYKVIMWSKDTIDWRDKDTNIIFKRATQNLSNGDLVLMHPKEHTLKVLQEIIEYYKNAGFNVVSVSDNISNT